MHCIYFYSFFPFWVFFFLFYLLMVDVYDSLQRQLFKVQFVTLIKVCAHGLRVTIHHHCLLAELTQCADTGDSTPIKFHAATYRDHEIGERGEEKPEVITQREAEIYCQPVKAKRANALSIQFFFQNINVRSIDIMYSILLAGKTGTR